MPESIKKNIELFFDEIIKKLLAIEDYLCFPKNIHASELALLAFGLLWFAWFVFFDVAASSPVYQYILSEKGWAVVFAAFVSLHFAGMFIPAIQVRKFALTGYAVTWFVWLVMVAYSRIESTATPTIFIIFILSVYVSTRISREKENDNS